MPKLVASLREHNKFAVLSHVRPDGDALGSTLALALSLKGLGKEVRAWNEEGMLEKYNFLAQAELLTQPPSAPEDFDVAVALDTAVQNRLGTTTCRGRSAKLWINIDHHPSNPRYGDLVYIDPTAPATGQILFEFLTNQKFPDHAGNRGKSLRGDLDRHRFVSVPEYNRAHVRDRGGAGSLRSRCRASQPVTLRKFSAPAHRTTARTIGHDAIRVRRKTGVVQFEPGRCASPSA